MKERLKELRKKLRLTQQDFAEKLSLSSNLIYLMEKGDRQITDRTIKDICRTFNVNEVWFKTGNGDMFGELLPIDIVQASFEVVVQKIGHPMPDIIIKLAQAYAEMDESDQKVMDELAFRLTKKAGE